MLLGQRRAAKTKSKSNLNDLLEAKGKTMNRTDDPIESLQSFFNGTFDKREYLLIEYISFANMINSHKIL